MSAVMFLQCPVCARAPGERISHHIEVLVDEVTYTLDVGAWRCSGCGEIIIGDETLMQVERAVIGAVAHGAPGPRAVRRLRRWLGLKAAELAALLGVHEATVSRWENAKIPVDPNAFALLGRMAVEDLGGGDATRRYLEQRGAARPAVMHLDPAQPG